MADRLDLDAIKARANGATPGWWQEIDDLDGGWQVHSGKGEEITGSGLPIADAEFIAHAREDVPALVAIVERVREVLLEMENLAEHGAFIRQDPYVLTEKLREAVDGV